MHSKIFGNLLNWSLRPNFSYPYWVCLFFIYDCIKTVSRLKRHIINIIEKMFMEILFYLRFCVKSLLRGTLGKIFNHNLFCNLVYTYSWCNAKFFLNMNWFQKYYLYLKSTYVYILNVVQRGLLLITFVLNWI